MRNASLVADLFLYGNVRVVTVIGIAAAELVSSSLWKAALGGKYPFLDKSCYIRLDIIGIVRGVLRSMVNEFVWQMRRRVSRLGCVAVDGHRLS